MSCTATINETESVAPQMITVKDTMSPTSHLYSEKISIARDAAIFEIKRENYCPNSSPDGARFSSRYEIYNSTTRPFGKCYRELTLTSSSSTTSGGCETGSSSSCCSETTTYVTCNSESEPVQMTGFQHNMEEELEQLCKNNSDSDIRIVVKSDIRSCRPTVPDTEETGEDKELEDKVKPNVKSIKIEAWRSAVDDDDDDGGGQILKSPKILREMIKHYEQSNDEVVTVNGAKEPEFCPATGELVEEGGGKVIGRCRSLLNLECRDKEFEEETNKSKVISKKSVSEIDLNQQTDEERQTLSSSSSRDNSAKGHAPAEEEISKKIVNIAIRPDKKYSRIKLEDKFEKKMNDLLLGRKLRAASTSSCSAVNEALANDVVVVESAASKLQSSERSWNCRVTGELRKNTIGVNGGSVLGTGSTFEQRYGDLCTLPRTAKSHRSQLQRHFYYHNGRPRSMLLKDDELPDPDKVKLARELFENVLKLRSRANDTTACGKFNTINCWKPRSNEDANALNGSQRTEDLKWNPQYRQQQQRHQKVRRTITLETDQPSSGGAAVTTTKWTDDRSLSSSGVGSDVSGETDSDSNPRGADTSSDCSNKDETTVFSSEDEGQPNGDGTNVNCLGQPVSSEILNKIRAFGTSVTYYGGKVIARNEGHTCSPMTMTIMDEIRQHTRNDQIKAGTLDGKLFSDRKYFGTKFELRKSISCDSRLERSCDDVTSDRRKFSAAVSDDAKTTESENIKSEPIKEEDAKEEVNRVKERTSSTTSLRTKQEVVIGKRTVANSYSEMEFEEFQVLDDIIAETDKKSRT